MPKHIRGLNLETEQAWDEAVYDDHFTAYQHLEQLRGRRGHWKENPVVYAIIDPETKIQARNLKLEGFKWAIQVVEEAET